MLERYVDDPALFEALVPPDELRPFPPAADRAFWDSLPESYRSRVLDAAAGYEGREWPHIPPEVYLDFFRTGDRSRFQSYYHPRRTALGLLTLAACIRNDGRYTPEIVRVVLAICEESTWVLPAHISDGQPGGLPRPDTAYFDITAARTAADLAIAVSLLGPELDAYDPAVAERVACELHRRIVVPYVEHDEFWWMKLTPSPRRSTNNWNPWCNFGALAAALFSERDPQTRRAAVRRYLRSVQRFIDYYHADGSCDERPSYWAHSTGSLFEGLELLRAATDGYVDVYHEPKLRAMARYVMETHVAASHFVNYGDCVPQLAPPAGIVYRLGERLGDESLAAFGRYLWRKDRTVFREELSKAMHLAAAFPAIEEPGSSPMPADRYWRKIDVAIAREQEGNPSGFFLAARGGSNGESHSHNDVGSFMVYLDGSPLVIDPGVESYRKESFSADRYSIWTMQSRFHNLPMVAGHAQVPGWGARARDVRHSATAEGSELVCDLAPCYPEDAGVESWIRRSALVRDGEETDARVVVDDRFRLGAAGAQLAWVLMLTGPPRRVDESSLALVSSAGGEAHLLVESERTEGLSFDIEPIALTDAKMTRYWGEEIVRVVVSTVAAERAGSLTVTISRV